MRYYGSYIHYLRYAHTHTYKYPIDVSYHMCDLTLAVHSGIKKRVTQMKMLIQNEETMETI